MTDRDALYRSILAHPADDTPRLVYADWLEENDRAEEAEFIRVECRLDSITPDDAEYSELLDRQEELRLWLAAHMPGPELKLATGLRVEGGLDWWTQTLRGFPRFLEFDGHQYTGAKPMRALAAALGKAFTRLPTRWLALRFVSIVQLAELLKHPVLAGLDRLTIQLGATDDPQDEACLLIAECAHLRNLRDLIVTFPIGDAGAATLARSDHLGRLNRFRLDQMTWCTPAAIRSLGASPWFRGLLSLDLSELDDSIFEELCRLAPFSNLHTLKFQEGSFSRSAWQTFARSKSFPRLSRLVNDTEMADGQAAVLASATDLDLRVLELSSCAIGNDGAAALSRAPWFGGLRRLDLSFNRLTAAGFAAIAGSRALTELQYLDLSYSTPGVRGLRALAANPALKRLTTLLLAGSVDRTHGLTPTLFQDFLTRLNMPKLRRLDLSRRPLGAQHKS